MSKAIELGCLILCGGRGTRLQSVVPDKPKALAEVNGIPFIYLLLKQLGCFQFGEVILCTGYQGNQVKDAVGEQYENLKVIYSEENEPLGTGGAIKNAVTHIRQPMVVVLNGDSYVEYDLKGLVSQHQKVAAKFSIVLREVPNVGRYGSVALGTGNRITSFSEKMPEPKKRQGWINAGIYLINRECINEFPGKIPVSLEREVLPSLVGNGLWGFPTTGEFIDIGTPDSLLSAGEFFKGVEL
ncbi:MAG: nucleotidyltransferase family protein [Dehalococcoidia bacterium]|jgi:NDP-sugar pyrophosphorylase family protein|nr:nucleotidyltransferase family protein [Dehalococcoidia bacterium]|tara:strand:- start:1924 stop:2646 length:723 start_codon:yes stop_codon:yes gene_type:complete